MAGAVSGEPSEVPELPGIDPELDTVLIDRESRHAGRLFGQCTVGGRLYDDVHGAGWRLLTTGNAWSRPSSSSRRRGRTSHWSSRTGAG
jgi:hypothetical protein